MNLNYQMNDLKPLRLGMDRLGPNNEFIPNGISERSQHVHWSKGRRIRHQFCNQPFLTVLKNLGIPLEIDLLKTSKTSWRLLLLFRIRSNQQSLANRERSREFLSLAISKKRRSRLSIREKQSFSSLILPNKTIGDFYSFRLFENSMALERQIDPSITVDFCKIDRSLKRNDSSINLHQTVCAWCDKLFWNNKLL